MCIGEGRSESPGATVAHAQRLAMRDHHLRAWRRGAAAGDRESYSSVLPAVSATAIPAPYEPCAEDYTIPLSVVCGYLPVFFVLAGSSAG